VRSRSTVTTLLAVVTVGVALTACAANVPSASSVAAVPTQPPLGPFPSDLVAGLQTATDVPYTETTDCGGTACTVPGDVLAPATGSDMPTVVMLGGGSTPFAERRYQEDLAVALAERGAVVFLMSYRSAVTGNYDSDSYSDVRCAVRFARAETADYGGDPGRVVVVGHSQGGLMGLDVAIQPEQDAEACLADGSGKPDGVVALGSPRPRFTGTGESAPPMWLFSGSSDGDAEGTAQRLRDQGFDAEARELPGVTHDGITDPAAAPEVVHLIMEALSSISSMLGCDQADLGNPGARRSP
jgi:acetyl esterase/lipase